MKNALSVRSGLALGAPRGRGRGRAILPTLPLSFEQQKQVGVGLADVREGLEDGFKTAQVVVRLVVIGGHKTLHESTFPIAGDVQYETAVTPIIHYSMPGW